VTEEKTNSKLPPCFAGDTESWVFFKEKSQPMLRYIIENMTVNNGTGFKRISMQDRF